MLKHGKYTPTRGKSTPGEGIVSPTAVLDVEVGHAAVFIAGEAIEAVMVDDLDFGVRRLLSAAGDEGEFFDVCSIPGEVEVGSEEAANLFEDVGLLIGECICIAPSESEDEALQVFLIQCDNLVFHWPLSCTVISTYQYRPRACHIALHLAVLSLESGGGVLDSTVM